MKADVKPGTRCECPIDGHGVLHGHHCHNDAARLVTVRVADAQLRRDDPHGQHDFDVPMCAACAEYHEGGAK